MMADLWGALLTLFEWGLFVFDVVVCILAMVMILTVIERDTRSFTAEEKEAQRRYGI